MPPSTTGFIEHPLSDTDRFRLGPWLVDPGSGQIAQGETVLRVEPKAMDVLVYLASHQGQVVSREDLERHVWRGALVGYDAVTGTIIKLRKALDDDPWQPRYIATVPKRGYRLLPEVVQALEPMPVEAALVPPASTPSRTHALPARVPKVPWTWMAAIGR